MTTFREIIWVQSACLLSLCLLVAATSSFAASCPADTLALIRGMVPAYAKVADYTAVFDKQELVRGKLMPGEHILLKFKKPFKVRMTWLKGPHEGREGVYVKGMNGDKMIGHEGGFLSFIKVNIDPFGTTAMKRSRHPVTDIGIGKIVEVVTSNVDRAIRVGDLSAEQFPDDELCGGRAGHVRLEFPSGRGYYSEQVELWVDRAKGLPVKIEVFGRDGGLLEHYEYRELKLNPGIPDEAFVH